MLRVSSGASQSLTATGPRADLQADSQGDKAASSSVPKVDPAVDRAVDLPLDREADLVISRIREHPVNSLAAHGPSTQHVPALRLQVLAVRVGRAARVRAQDLAHGQRLARRVRADLGLRAERLRRPAKPRVRSVLQGRRVAEAVSSSIQRPKKAR